MPTTIYDSSLLTQRTRDKTISNSFINRATYASGSAPLLGITQDSILNNVANGQMKYYRKGDITTVDNGCPCAPLNPC